MLGAWEILPKGLWRARGGRQLPGPRKDKAPGAERAGGGGAESNAEPHTEGTAGPSSSAASHNKNDFWQAATVAAAD